MTDNPYTGFSFDDFLSEEELYEECSAIAIKRVLARQLEKEMKRQNLTKTEMAKQMQTSRAQLDERWSVPTLRSNGESANADC